ncbi:MAG TPA: hypothetical protein VM408_08845 [Methylomirabilota bacterium]|nr:hypothetical protein [Methylomirabilota bacterium]
MRRFLALFAVPVLLAMTAAPAFAMDRFYHSFTEQDEFWTETCGFTVVVDATIRGHQIAYDDGRVTFTIVETTRFTSPYGTLIYRQSHTAHRQPPTTISVVDGVRTDTVVYPITGLGFALIDPGTGRVMSDRGSVTVQATFRVDEATGDVLSVSFEILDVSGPHPRLTTPDSTFNALFCAALAS